MRISDWSSDVCSSDLGDQEHVIFGGAGRAYDRNIFDYMAREYYGGAFTSYTLLLDTPLHECDAAANTSCIPFVPSLIDRKSVVSGKSVSGRVELGGRRSIKQKKKNNKIIPITN